MRLDEHDLNLPHAAAADAVATAQPDAHIDDTVLELLEPTIDALIRFALAEANWAEQAIHPTMSAPLRQHHERHAFMNLTIAKRLEELKEIGP